MRSQVVESLGTDTVIFLPDQYLAKYVASQTKVKIIAWKGACEVHERFTGDELRHYRASDPSLQIIAHPECPPDVIAEADYTGSTAGMIDWVRKNRPQPRRHGHGMLDGRQRAGRIARRRVRAAVQSLPAHEADHAAEDSRQPASIMKEEVVIDPAIAAKARRSVERDGEPETLEATAPVDDGAPMRKQSFREAGPMPRGLWNMAHRFAWRDGSSYRSVSTSALVMTTSLLCPDAFLSPLEIDAVVTRALAEDLGRAGDVTSIATIPRTRRRARSWSRARPA